MRPKTFLGQFAFAALVACILALPPGTARAADVDELSIGPKVGEMVGSVINAKDHTGEARNIRSLRGKKGLILLVSRSFDW